MEFFQRKAKLFKGSFRFRGRKRKFLILGAVALPIQKQPGSRRTAFQMLFPLFYGSVFDAGEKCVPLFIRQLFRTGDGNIFFLQRPAMSFPFFMVEQMLSVLHRKMVPLILRRIGRRTVRVIKFRNIFHSDVFSDDFFTAHRQGASFRASHQKENRNNDTCQNGSEFEPSHVRLPLSCSFPLFVSSQQYFRICHNMFSSLTLLYYKRFFTSRIFFSFNVAFL